MNKSNENQTGSDVSVNTNEMKKVIINEELVEVRNWDEFWNYMDDFPFHWRPIMLEEGNYKEERRPLIFGKDPWKIDNWNDIYEEYPIYFTE